MMNRLSLHSSSHKYSPTVSGALSHGLNFKIFLGEHAPRPPYKTVHAIYTWPRSRTFERRTVSDECAKAGGRGLRMHGQLRSLCAAPISTLYVFPPSSISGSAPV